MHRGLPCSGLSISKLVACGPPGTSCSTFSFKMSPPTSGPTCDDDGQKLNIWRVIQVLIEIESRKMFLVF
jgi:hypothetical protein